MFCLFLFLTKFSQDFSFGNILKRSLLINIKKELQRTVKTDEIMLLSLIIFNNFMNIMARKQIFHWIEIFLKTFLVLIKWDYIWKYWQMIRVNKSIELQLYFFKVWISEYSSQQSISLYIYIYSPDLLLMFLLFKKASNSNIISTISSLITLAKNFWSMLLFPSLDLFPPNYLFFF